MTTKETIRVSISSILAFEQMQLVRRPEWEPLNFSDTATALSQIFSACRQLLDSLSRLPPEACEVAENQLSRLNNVLLSIDSFDTSNTDAVSARNQLAHDIRQAAGDFQANVSAWGALISIAAHVSPMKRFVGYLNEFKEVIGLLIAVSIVWSYFATKDELTNNVDRIQCLLTSNVSALSIKNNVHRLTLELERENRELERAQQQNAHDSIIDSILQRQSDTKRKLINAQTREADIETRLNALMGRIDWSTCPIS